MTLLLDTGAIRARDREPAIRAVLDGTTLPMRLEPTEPQHKIDIRMRVWQLGGDGTLFSAQGSGMRMQRTTRHISSSDAPLVSVSVQPKGRAQFTQRDETRTARAGSMFLACMYDPYEYVWSGQGESISVQLPLDRLELNHDDVQRSSLRLAASPLYQLVRDHVRELVTCADSFDSSQSGAVQATTDLIRALIVSASVDEPASAIDDDALWAMVLSHIRRHIRAANLDVGQVANALRMNAESLQRLARARNADVDTMILIHKLHGARRELTRPTAPELGTTWLARRWGFTDVDLFRRLFYAKYGYGPDDWDALDNQP